MKTKNEQTGICNCGCGGITYPAKQTDKRSGLVKGELTKYLPGHRKSSIKYKSKGPNPSGLCMCGCGQKTRLARKTNNKSGLVAGKPCKYLPGHQTRFEDTPLSKICSVSLIVLKSLVIILQPLF
jgi:hypothetical protein